MMAQRLRPAVIIPAGVGSDKNKVRMRQSAVPVGVRRNKGAPDLVPSPFSVGMGWGGWDRLLDKFDLAVRPCNDTSAVPEVAAGIEDRHPAVTPTDS